MPDLSPPDPLRDLPQGIVTTTAPQSKLSSADIMQPYEGLARALDKTGEALNDVAVPLAERQGAQAGQTVTRDADGNLQVAPSPVIFGPAGAAYTRALKVGALAQADGDAKRADLELRQQYRDNPGAYDAAGNPTGGYLAAADAFRKKQIQQYSDALGPAVGSAVGQAIQSTTTQTYRGLLNEKERLDLERADGAMKARQTSASDDAMTLARQGVALDDPAMKTALDAYTGVLDERANNPRLAYTKEQRDLDLQQFESNLGAQHYLHGIAQTYASGGAPAAETEAKNILTDPGYKLSQPQREAYYHQAIGEVRANEAIRRQDLGEARASFTELSIASASGVPIDPNQVEMVRKAFKAAGDPGGVARVDGFAARMNLNDSFTSQPLAEQSRQLNVVRGLAGMGGMQGDDAASVIRHFEGFRPNAYWDVNHWRTGYGSDTITRPDGSTAPVTAFTTVTKDDAERDLARRIGQSQGQISQAIGPDAWAKLSPHAQASLTSVAYNYGHLPSSVATAAQTGDEGLVAGAVGGLAANPGRRAAEAANIVGKFGLSGPTAAAAIPSSLSTSAGPAGSAWLAANRQMTMNEELWSNWKTVMKDWDEKGIVPNTNAVSDINDAVRVTGNAALHEQIASDMDRINVVQQLRQAPLGTQTAAITQLQGAAQAGNLAPGQVAVVKDLERSYAAMSKGLDENPIQTIAANLPDKVKTPDPLDLQNPQNLIAGLKQRGQIAQIGAQNYQTGPLSALDKQDIVQVKAALANPDPSVKAGIYGAIATLPEDVRAATLRKLGGGEPAAMTEAAAGGLMAEDPAIAASIFRGQAAMKTDKRYDPESEAGSKTTYLGDMDRQLPASMFSLQDRTDPAGGYATMASMAKARYADLSAQAQDTSYSQSRLQQAVGDVTGGLLRQNGSYLIAPVRGMPQPQFDGIMRGIDDPDMAGVKTLSGQPVTADYLKSNGTLESIGGGKYFVRLGNGGVDKPIYAYKDGQKFALDLAHRAAAPPDALNLPTSYGPQ